MSRQSSAAPSTYGKSPPANSSDAHPARLAAEHTPHGVSRARPQRFQAHCGEQYSPRKGSSFERKEERKDRKGKERKERICEIRNVHAIRFADSELSFFSETHYKIYSLGLKLEGSRKQ